MKACYKGGIPDPPQTYWKRAAFEQGPQWSHMHIEVWYTLLWGRKNLSLGGHNSVHIKYIRPLLYVCMERVSLWPFLSWLIFVGMIVNGCSTCKSLRVIVSHCHIFSNHALYFHLFKKKMCNAWREIPQQRNECEKIKLKKPICMSFNSH